ncbi:PREDICTED: single-stranded DNA-binding protein, mitochondrial-like [Priapulus caudatus]|uniref:Single-stranded DNA-binding protein, mitochondrial-like n=1 Tax=Priapulus caudatus TaxID=37621 RepID=A0ABM1EPW7_PRICU|nr:PREDICTED: single-stranded DNA-binding protein, mitochondrial-like [Priapulus caudatus]
MFRNVVSQLIPTLQREFCTSATLRQTYEKCINQVTLLGRVGADPMLRGTEQHPVVIFSMATNMVYTDANQERTQKAEWHRISIFKPTLREPMMNYLKKGMRVHVSGRLSYGMITDASGVQRSTTSIVADDVIFLSSSRDSGQDLAASTDEPL